MPRLVGAMPLRKFCSVTHACSLDACRKLCAAETARVCAHVRGAAAHAWRSAAELCSHQRRTFSTSMLHVASSIFSPRTCRKYAAAEVVSPFPAAHREHKVHHCAALQGAAARGRALRAAARARTFRSSLATACNAVFSFVCSPCKAASM